MDHFESRWEKYDAKGWTEKGAHKYGRLNEQSWWEKWGEHYDGRGSVLKWYSVVLNFSFLPFLFEILNMSLVILTVLRNRENSFSALFEAKKVAGI